MGLFEKCACIFLNSSRQGSLPIHFFQRIGILKHKCTDRQYQSDWRVIAPQYINICTAPHDKIEIIIFRCSESE